jgi:hypothetical protein
MAKLAALTAALGLAAAAVAGAGLASPATSRPHREPVHFLSSIVRLIAANRYAQAWRWLDPADQALATEPVYVACESQTPIPGRLAALRVLQVGHDQIGVAVRFAASFTGTSPSDQARVVFTAHAVHAPGRWAWILPTARRALYRDGCGR